jgi:TonB family protein
MIQRISILVLTILLVAVGDNAGKRIPCIRHFQSLNYDNLARIMREQGDVPLHVMVDKQGNVENVECLPTTTTIVLQKSAAENIKRWTFEPEDKFEFTIIYEFRLLDHESEYPQPSNVTIDFPLKFHIETYYQTISN